MNERLASAAPTPEQLGATFRGLTWNQFRALSDEEIGQLHETLRNEALAALGIPFRRPQGEEEQVRQDLAFTEQLREGIVLSRFATWRRYGLPEDVTREEVDAHMRFIVADRQARDPSYGALPDGFKEMSDPQRVAVQGVFGYFREMRDPFEYLVVDDHSLQVTIGLPEDSVTSLVEGGVLEVIGEDPMWGNMYTPSEQYYNHWLVRRYGPPPDAEV